MLLRLSIQTVLDPGINHLLIFTLYRIPVPLLKEWIALSTEYSVVTGHFREGSKRNEMGIVKAKWEAGSHNGTKKVKLGRENPK